LTSSTCDFLFEDSMIELITSALGVAVDVVATLIAWLVKVVAAWYLLEMIEKRIWLRQTASLSHLGGEEARQWGLRILVLLHASFGCAVCLGYLVGFLGPSALSTARCISTVFMVREMIESWQHFAVPRPGATDNSLVQTVHHVLTIAILYQWFGFTLGRATGASGAAAGAFDGLLIYYWGEPPIVLMQYAWFLSKTGQEHTSTCIVTSQLVLPTWLFCRLFSFGCILLFVFVPTCSVWSLGSWISLLLLGVVYALNCWWFLHLLAKKPLDKVGSSGAVGAASVSPFLPLVLARLPLWQALNALAMRVSKLT
jgi:hypothetical protein